MNKSEIVSQAITDTLPKSNLVNSTTDVNNISDEISVLPAQNFKQLYSAFKLVHDEYCEAGLSNKNKSGIRFYLRELLPDSTTFVSLFKEKVIATVTVIRWSMASIPAFNIYKEEIQEAVDKGKFFAEATKFASVARKISEINEKRNPVIIFEELLKTIYHWCGILGVDYWISVIHPRQSTYYSKKLGFEIIGEEKDCGHVVGKPGVLIKLDIRSLIDGKIKPFKYFGRKMLSKEPLVSQFQNYHFLSSLEVLFLLIEDTEALEKASVSEKSLFDFYYPGILALVNKIEDSKKEVSFICEDISIAFIASPYFPELREFIDDSSSLKRYGVFDLKVLFLKTMFIAQIFAMSYGIKINFKDIKLANSIFYGQYQALGFILCYITKISIVSSGLRELFFEIEPWKEDLEKNVLRFRFISDNKISLKEIEIELDYIAGSYWTTQNSNGQWINNFSFNLLKIENGINSNLISQKLILSKSKNSETVILVAENNLLDQYATRRILEKRGFTVLTTRNGENAYDILSNQKVDLALIDVSLPGLDGLSLASRLRNTLGARLPLIAFTASVGEQDRSRIYRAGMNDLILKPQSIKELYKTIDFHLAQSYVIDGKPHFFQVA